MNSDRFVFYFHCQTIDMLRRFQIAIDGMIMISSIDVRSSGMDEVLNPVCTREGG